MKNSIKRIFALLLSAAMLAACLAMPAAAEVDLGLTWPGSSWPEGTPPKWAQEATAEEQAATIAAFNTEYQRQLDMGYTLGTNSFGGGAVRIGAWSNIVGVQCEGDNNSNIGDPWGMGRKWAIMIAPFPGMAFSVKGQISKQVAPSQSALSNQLEWTDPATGKTMLYQTFDAVTVMLNTDGSNLTYPNYTAGNYLEDDVKEKFQYAYSSSAWLNESFGKPYNPGHCVGNNPITEKSVIYQEFFGNESSGASPEASRGLDKAYGISYIAMDKDGDAAYLITDEMFNAWREKFWTLNSDGSYNKFGITGAPIANQFTENGIIYQEFKNGVICYNTATGEISDLVSNDTSIHGEDFDYTGYIKDGNKHYYLVPENVDITSFAPGFTVAESASISPAADEKQDFTNPVTYTVTAESGRSEAHTVAIYSEKNVTAADRAAAKAVSDLLEQIPVVIYRNTMEKAESAKSEYDKLTFMQKLLVRNAKAMQGLDERIAEIKKSPIKVACVGDSITEGVGARPDTPEGKSTYGYPGQLQNMLGDAYKVGNYGTSGSNVRTDKGYVYMHSGFYPGSLSFNPDIVIIALGTNDAGNLGAWDNTALEQFEADYRTLVQSYLDLDSKPIVMCALPTHSWNTGSGQYDGRNNNNITWTMPVIKKVAEEKNVRMLDMWSWSEGKLGYFPDGLHPGNDGYTLMAQEYQKYVLEAAETVSDISLDGIELNGEAFDNFKSDIYNYTVVVDDLNKLPEIAAKYAEADGKTVTVSQPTAENPTALVTVQSKAGMFGNAYTVRFVLPSEAFIKGDVDGNGVVNVSDIMTLKNLIMSSSWTEDQLKRGDIDDNKTLNVSDMLSIKSIIMEG